MAFVKDTLGKRALGAQYQLTASGYVDAATFAANDAADDIAAIEVPAGAVITRVSLTLETAFDVATTLTTTIVTADDGTDVLELDTNFDADSATARLREDFAVATEVESTVPWVVAVAIANITSLTAGRVRVDVDYTVSGRSNENDG